MGVAGLAPPHPQGCVYKWVNFVCTTESKICVYNWVSFVCASESLTVMSWGATFACADSLVTKFLEFGAPKTRIVYKSAGCFLQYSGPFSWLWRCSMMIQVVHALFKSGGCHAWWRLAQWSAAQAAKCRPKRRTAGVAALFVRFRCSNHFGAQLFGM